MFTPDAFGRRIQALRKEKGLSQQQLADNMFVSRKTVGNWEAGNRFPDITMISKLAEKLGVETYELLDEMYDSSRPANIIIVEDEPILLKGFLHVLVDMLPEAQIVGFQNAAEALAYAHAARVEIAFLDIELFGESGVELAKKLLRIHPRTNIIFLTGHTEYARDALDLHCSGYLLKPLTPEKIRTELSHLRFPLRSLKDSEEENRGKAP